MDKSDFLHFVNSVRWHCTILMKTTGLNEDIDRAVRGVCAIRPEWTKRNFLFDFLSEHQTEKIDGLNQLDVLIVHSDKLGRVNLELHVNF